VKGLELTIILSIIFLLGFSFKGSLSQYMDSVEPSEWDIASELSIQEFIDYNLLQDESVLKDSIVTKTIHSLEDELPPRIWIKILYAHTENQEIKFKVLGLKVVFQEINDSSNAYLEQIFESEYIPPKKILSHSEKYEDLYAKQLSQTILCKQGYEKILKKTREPVCVTLPTAIELVKRGWAHLDLNTPKIFKKANFNYKPVPLWLDEEIILRENHMDEMIFRLLNLQNKTIDFSIRVLDPYGNKFEPCSKINQNYEILEPYGSYSWKWFLDSCKNKEPILGNYTIIFSADSHEIIKTISVRK
jgi:hypothetical protein